MSKPLIEIPYLEDTDFNPDGSLKPHVNQGMPCVVMVQGNFCGYCNQAKPAFQQFADAKKAVACTIQIDGSPSEKKCAAIVQALDKSYRGVPCYLGFNSQGRYAGTHNGGRDAVALVEFASKLN